MYFRDTSMPCNKRAPGTGCSAIAGANRNLAILGTQRALHRHQPLRHERGDGRPGGEHSRARDQRRAQRPDRGLSPASGQHAASETVLEPGDLITHVTLPPPVLAAAPCILKLRDRASYEFALASAAVVINVEGGRIARAAHCPRRRGHEALEIDRSRRSARRPARRRAGFRRAADAALRDARPQSQNGFKVELARRCLVHALMRQRR